MTSTPTVAVVTGGSRGLGSAICDRLAEDRWTVIAIDIAAPVDDRRGFLELDVTAREEVDHAVGRIEDEFGAIGAWVNCAGVQQHMRLADGDPRVWDRVLAVNVTGTFNCLRAAGRRMISRGEGRIVNISSIAAERGGAARAPYSASKAAVNALTRAAAIEWASSGVRVNAVAPGWVDTDLLRAAVAEGSIDMDAVLSRIPMGTLTTADDVANAVAFLASDQSGHVTGHILSVDGGYLADYGLR